MRGVNKVILVGVLGKDPETKTFANGGSLTQFSIATSETWTDKTTGERKEQTEWHNIVLQNRLGEIAQQYLKKGSKVYIEGSLNTRKWTDQNGNDRYTTEVVLQRFRGELTLLGGREGGGGSGGHAGLLVPDALGDHRCPGALGRARGAGPGLGTCDPLRPLDRRDAAGGPRSRARPDGHGRMRCARPR